ncbi:MAG TPA: DMT family transporter [Polyangiaceae bacterium]|nr:DMT family transporter [Polyangiaceae bacterium]
MTTSASRLGMGVRAGAVEYVAILIGSTLLMGSSFVAGKILLSAGVPALLLVGFRFSVAALGALGFVAWEGGLAARELVPPALSRGDWLKVALIGLLQTGAVMGLLFIAMREIPAPMAALLLFTNPIWVALLARVFLHEALPVLRAVGLVLGAAGVALALGADGGASGASWRGQLIGLGSAFCWAAATLVNKRANLRLGVWALSFWQMLVGALALLAVAYLGGERWPSGLTAGHWGWFTWLALPASTGSFGLWFMALRRGGATRTSGYLFLAPLFAALLSHWLLGSSLSPRQALGGLAIGLGIWLVNRELKAGR